MKVILKSDVENLGRGGEVVRVKPGYARNFLFPKKLAWPAFASSMKEVRHKEKIAQVKAKKALQIRSHTAEKLEGLSLVFYRKITSQNRLFGSVSAFDAASALKEKGIIVDKKFIRMESPIKMLGEHSIFIDLGQKSESKILVSVRDEKEKAKEESTASSFLSKVLKKVTPDSSKKEAEKANEKEAPKEIEKEAEKEAPKES